MDEARPLVAVFGSSTAVEPDAVWTLAYDLGAALGSAGADVMTGGYGGAMAACSRGAHDAGAHVVGVTVDLFERRSPVNRWVKERVHTPDLYERLRHIVSRADGFVATPGSLGTLSEILLTWTLLSVGGRPPGPLVLLGPLWAEWLETHRRPGLVPEPLFRHVELADSARDAARRVLAGIATARGIPPATVPDRERP